MGDVGHFDELGAGDLGGVCLRVGLRNEGVLFGADDESRDLDAGQTVAQLRVVEIGDVRYFRALKSFKEIWNSQLCEEE